MFCIIDGNYLSKVRSLARMLIDFSLDEAVERSDLSVEAADFVSQHACTFSVEQGVVRANRAASALAPTLLPMAAQSKHVSKQLLVEETGTPHVPSSKTTASQVTSTDGQGCVL